MAPTSARDPAFASSAMSIHGNAASPTAGDGSLKVYGEQHIVPLPNQEREGAVPALVSALKRESSPQARTDLVRSVIRGIGFDWLAYGTATDVGGQLQPRTYLETYAPALWRQRYFNERYYEIDPRSPKPGYFGLPMVWDADDMEKNLANGAHALRMRHFLDDMRDAGVRSGVLMHLAAPGSSDCVFISLMSNIESRRWISDLVIGQALTAGLSLHEFISHHAEIPHLQTRHGDGLSDVQRGILGCLAQGLSDKQIATRLDMSIFNVDYHMRRLRSHFGVRNRVQLASAAVTLQVQRGLPVGVQRSAMRTVEPDVCMG
jgi:DNA-binding CsgD family transcriptional regulator